MLHFGLLSISLLVWTVAALQFSTSRLISFRMPWLPRLAHFSGILTFSPWKWPDFGQFPRFLTGTWPPKDSSRPFPQCHSHVTAPLWSGPVCWSRRLQWGSRWVIRHPRSPTSNFRIRTQLDGTHGTEISGGVRGVEMCRTATAHEILKFLGFNKIFQYDTHWISFSFCVYPLVNIQKTIENGHL